VFDAISQGLILGTYKYDKFKTNKKPNTLERIDLINTQDDTSYGTSYNFKEIINESDSRKLVRNLINEPPNYMNPSGLENVAKDIVENSELELTILNVKEMKDLGMEVILGVGQGSKNDPKMIIINYNGDNMK
jgi:leucyl aminopeptidase